MNAHERLAVGAELRKRLAYPYLWPGVQTDVMDRQTRFIYHTPCFDEVLLTLTTYAGRPDFLDVFNYALNRWYNFWSSQVVESIFCALPGVVPAPKYDRHVDFSIHGIPFDHKTTVFPKGYGGDLDSALQAPHSLVHWLYTNQSQQQRCHWHNRLFLVLHADDGEHWRLKADTGLLATAIEEYMDDFSPADLIPCEMGSNQAMAGLIWVVQPEREARQQAALKRSATLTT